MRKNILILVAGFFCVTAGAQNFVGDASKEEFFQYYYNLGKEYYQQGDYAIAAEYLAKAIDYRSDREDVRSLHADSCYHQGNYKCAQEGYRELAHQTGRYFYYAKAGLAYARSGISEAALSNFAVRCPVKGEPHVLQGIDRIDRLLTHHVHSVLIGQIVATLDRVKGVPFPHILLEVAQGCSNAPLGCAGVGAGGVQLAENGRAGVLR